MIRILRATVMTLLAVLALSAMAASAASASENPTYKSAGAPTTITGSQIGEKTFEMFGATWKCKTSTFHAEQTTAEAHTLSLHPTYSECPAFGLAKGHITTTGCNYVLKTPTTNGSGGYHAAVDIVCSAGNLISLTPTFSGVSMCTVTIGSQSPGGVADLQNEAGGKLRVTWTLTGIKYTSDKCGEKEGADGTLSGEVLLGGSAGAVSVG